MRRLWGKKKKIQSEAEHPARLCFCFEGSAKETGVSEALSCCHQHADYQKKQAVVVEVEVLRTGNLIVWLCILISLLICSLWIQNKGF